MSCPASFARCALGVGQARHSSSPPRSDARSSRSSSDAAVLGVREHRLDRCRRACASAGRASSSRSSTSSSRPGSASMPLGVGAQLARRGRRARRRAPRTPLGERVERRVDAARCGRARPRPPRAAPPRRRPPPRPAIAASAVAPPRLAQRPRHGAAARARRSSSSLLRRARSRPPRSRRARSAAGRGRARGRPRARGILRQLPLDPHHLGVSVAIGAPSQGEVPIAGEPVERLELGGCEGQLAVLVLAVEGEEACADRLQIGCRGPRRPARKALVRPGSPRLAGQPTAPWLPSGSRSAISASSGSSSRAIGELEDPLERRPRSPPGRTIWDRALPLPRGGRRSGRGSSYRRRSPP